MEVCELLSVYEFFGDDIFIIVGLVLRVLEEVKVGNVGEWGEKVFKFMVEVDFYIFILERDIEKIFLMLVEDVFFIVGRGIVVIGRIERGVVKVGDEVEIVGIRVI